LIAAEAARPTRHLDALDYILRGRAVLLKRRTPDTYQRQLVYTSAPWRSVDAQSRLAGSLAGRALDLMSDSAAVDLTRAEGRPPKPWRHHPAARMLITSKAECCARRTDGRRPFPNARRRLNPNLVGALSGLGGCNSTPGR
jgi:hypothetical protein